MNLILVTIDSLRHDVVFGEDALSSLPALESFQSDSTTCSRAFTAAPYTADSFRTILSGTYPWRFGTTPEGFEQDRPHLAEVLAEAGYRTAGFYTNPYLGPAFDYDRGWDHYVKGNVSEDGTIDQVRNFVVENVPPESRLFSLFRWTHRTIGERFGIEMEGKPYPEGEEVVRTFLEWLDSVEERPVFGWLHFMDVHSPFYPHDGTVSAEISRKKAVETFYSVNKRPTAASDKELDLLRTLYRGEIQQFDTVFGALIDGIDARLGTEETTILFTSDHGEAFDEHGFCFHPKELYDELVHVPFLLRSPMLGQNRIDVPVSTADILPTLLHHAGVEKPEACDGTALSDLGEESETRHVYAHAFEADKMKAMVTNGQWKLIRSLLSEDAELYNREDDPRERENKIDEQPTASETLQTSLADHLQRMETEKEHGGDREVSDEVQQRLSDLGYQ